MHVAVLYNRNPRLSRAVAALLRAEPGLVVGENAPYQLTDETDYGVPVHAEARGLDYLEIEIRQDLVQHEVRAGGMGGAVGAAAAAGAGDHRSGKQGMTAKMGVSRKQPVAAAERKLLCFVDRIDETGMGGWAVDFDAAAQSLRLRVMIDGVIADVVSCDLHRDDARLVTQANSRIGFYYSIPERYHDGLRHTMTFATLDGVAVPVSSRNGAMAALSFCLAKPTRVEAVVDGLVGGLIQGWALRVDERAGTKLGGVRILVTSAGQPVAEVTADQFRGDVADGDRWRWGLRVQLLSARGAAPAAHDAAILRHAGEGGIARQPAGDRVPLGFGAGADREPDCPDG